MKTKDHMWIETRNLQIDGPSPGKDLLILPWHWQYFWLLVVFYGPRGVMRWYTPQYGYMYIRWILIVAIWQVYIFNFWPLKLDLLKRNIR